MKKAATTTAKAKSDMPSALIDGRIEELNDWRGEMLARMYKAVVKMTFAKGASLDDPDELFNSSLEGNTRRAIDFHEGDKINEKALKALIREAIALNESTAAAKAKSPKAKKY